MAESRLRGVGDRELAPGRSRNGARADGPTRADLALGAWICVILVATLTPTGGENEFHPWPFQEISNVVRQPGDPSQWTDLFGNIFLFVPLGALLYWRSRPGLRVAVLAGFGLSLSVEVIQVFVPGRWTSTDDVLLNTLGAFIGYCAGHRAHVLSRLR